MRKTAIVAIGIVTTLGVSASIIQYYKPHDAINVVISETGVPIKISHTSSGIPVKFVKSPESGIPVVIVDDKQDSGIPVIADNK